MAEIQRADDRSRRLAILAVVIVSLGGVALAVQFEVWLAAVRDMPTEVARESLISVFCWGVGIGSLAIFLAGCHVWWWGRRVRISLRFPPPSAKVLRDTMILSGHAAASRGMFLQVLGALLLLSVAGIVLLSWWALRTFDWR